MPLNWVYIAIAVVSAILTTALAPKPKQRNQRNEVQRLGVDHSLEIVYGRRRVGLVVTDAMVSRKRISPDSLAPIPNVIRSNHTYKGKTESESDSKNSTLIVTGPLCVQGRLNAPFRGVTPEDVRSLVDGKEYDDPTLRTIPAFNVGSFFELHQVSGVRHPLDDYFNLGGPECRYTNCISATAGYLLNLEKELVYSGIPEQTFDVLSNLLHDPSEGTNVWNDPATWTGRADNPVLQLLDYFLNDTDGVGLTMSEMDGLAWVFTATIGDVPTAVTHTTTTGQTTSGAPNGFFSYATEVKTHEPGYLFESNITINTENTIIDNLRELQAGCRGAAIYKNRTGKWAIKPDWLHEDDLQQTFTGVTGTGPFDMDWPTSECIVKKNGLELTTGFTIVTSATLTTTIVNGSPTGSTGTDPDTVIGISFDTPLIATDVIEIDYQLTGANPDGIFGMPTEFHIVDSPETIGLDYDGDVDQNGLEIIAMTDPAAAELAPVSLDDRYNQCVVKFPDANTKYKQNQVTWPETDSQVHSEFLAADNNKPLVLEVSINSITDVEKALDYAEFMVRRSRSGDTYVAPLGIWALQLEPNDTCLVHDIRNNINGELWRVRKTVRQTDTSVKVTFSRYDREDFTYAVERFAQDDVEIVNDTFGPVENLAFTPGVTDGIEGSGSLSWSATTNAQAASYLAAVSEAAVWTAADAYTTGQAVYYQAQHYSADVAIGSGQAPPDSNNDWTVIDEDEYLWQQFANTPSLTAVVPDVVLGRIYAYRVIPQTALRNNGLPAYLEHDATDLASSRFTFIVVTFFQDTEPTPYDENNQWIKTDADDELYLREAGAWVAQPINGWALAFSNGLDPAIRALGRSVTFFSLYEPTDKDVPGYPAEVLEDGYMWINFANGGETKRYDGTAWKRYQAQTGISYDDRDPVLSDNVTVENSQNNLADLVISSGLAYLGLGTAHNFQSTFDGEDQFMIWSMWDSDPQQNGRSISWQNLAAEDLSAFVLPYNTYFRLDGDLKYGLNNQPLFDFDALLRSGFYVIGDSLTSVMGGEGLVATYDTDGSGNVTNPQATAGGTGYPEKGFILCASEGTETAWFDCAVTGGVVTGLTVRSQSGAFTASQTGVNIPHTGSNITSWAYRLVEKGNNITIDAQVGRGVVSGPGYTFPGDPATLEKQHLLIVLGSNDAGSGVDVATFEAAYIDLIQSAQGVGWTVGCVLPFYFQARGPGGTPDPDLYRDAVKSAAEATGAEWFNVPIGQPQRVEWELGAGVHPTQGGQEMLKREFYGRMSEWTSLKSPEQFERVRWRGLWYQTTYQKSDMANEGGYLGIANKETSDHLEPQPIGDEVSIYEGPDPTWTITAHTGHVYTSHIINAPTDALYEINTVAVWVQDITADDHYQLYLQNLDTGVIDLLAAFDGDTLTAPGWRNVAIPATIITPGANFSLTLHQWNSFTSTTTPANYVRASNSNANTDPGTGNWNRANNSSTLRFNNTDDDGTDRSALIRDPGLIGSTLRIINNADASQWQEYTILAIQDGTTFVYCTVTAGDTGGGGEPPVGATCQCDFAVAQVGSTNYVTLPNHLAAFANISGQIEFDSTFRTFAPITQDGYGINIGFQEYLASLDWDIAVVPSGSGAGGGGGDYVPKDGTEALPALTGSTDLTSGMYFGQNEVSQSVAGVKRFSVSAFGVGIFGGHSLSLDSGDLLVGGKIQLAGPGPLLQVGSTNVTTGAARVEVGQGRAGDGLAYLDLIGDTVYTDYGLRLMRQSGENANSVLIHRGTGPLILQAAEAADLYFQSAGITQLLFDQSATVWNFQGNEIRTSGILQVGDGSALLPAIHGATDALSGLFFSNQQIRFSINTLELFDINAFGLQTLNGAGFSVAGELIANTDPTSGTGVGNRAYNDGRYATTASPTFTGQVTFDDGSVILPSIRGSDADSGLSFAASLVLIGIDQVERLRVNAAGVSITGLGNVTGAWAVGGALSCADPTTDAHVGDRGYNDARYAASSHNHSAGDINSGTLPVSRGGTGVTSSTGTGSTVRSGSPTLTGTTAINRLAVGNPSSSPSASVELIVDSTLACEGMPSSSGTDVVNNFGVLGLKSSDLRYKLEWEDIDGEEAVAVVMDLQPGGWIWDGIHGQGHDYGFGAQHLAKTLPEAAPYDKDKDRWGYRETPIVAHLTAMCQEQQRCLEAQQTLIEQLMQRIEDAGL